ncbi:tRNA-specific 2-thiouridylase MnmA [Rubripirellula lacrimiformis]|uniref:tRNA-specific 2-thiouridylase MnmA n=1 Tax=Rubripirellula lacrimiformis TaxID=1930273 RepID=A0A517NBM3_9BACT|nr:ATP-dependent sacrificial sulfur transferase LarE [Rubripirellula lacrimiformis]QDT04520.1 tRNA-specific 2-thiouridylase MnmA [Rubripirellula lacrimiformis]
MSNRERCVETDANRLIDWFAKLGDVAVAFSGGVDSSVVAAAAQRCPSIHAIAVTARSPSLSQRQLDVAVRVAHQIGIEHRVIDTGEIDNADYRRNDGRRCFHCKATLYQSMATILNQFPGMTTVSGTNHDDLGDYRPGLEAAGAAGVQTPLSDLGMTKVDVRGLAKHFGLTNYDLPAAPCLASRVAYGTEVTTERLGRIEAAEAWLQQHGFDELRVRLHDGELARVEVPKHRIADLIQLDRDEEMTKAFLGFGFRFVTVDTRGLRSGNLNQMLVSIQSNFKPAVTGDPLDVTGESPN